MQLFIVCNNSLMLAITYIIIFMLILFYSSFLFYKVYANLLALQQSTIMNRNLKVS